jgi:ElaB/YqjD/DUF883 family membrane-anchored ribosome-binding protein
MTNPTAPTPEDLAVDASQLGRDAISAAGGIAAEAKAIASDSSESVGERADDMKELAEEAADTVRGLRADLTDLAREAKQVVGTYTSYVADVAAEKFAAAKEGVANGKELCEDYVRREPVKAALFAAAAGAILTKLLLVALTSKSRKQRQGQIPDR